MNTTRRKATLKEGEIVPITFDYVFTNIFNNDNNIKLIENFLSCYFDVPLENIRGKVSIKNRNLPLENKKSRYKQVDLILDLNGKRINLELNNNLSAGKKERNVTYVCNVHGGQLKVGDNDYSKINDTIQINLNNYETSDELKEEYYFSNEKGKIYTKKIRIDTLNLQKGASLCYTNSETKLARWCLVFISKSHKEFIKALGGDLMEEEAKEILIDEVDKYSDDDEVVALYSNYSKEELERNTLITEARLDGLKKGEERGILKTARKMSEKNMDISLISELTGLDPQEIEKLK